MQISNFTDAIHVAGCHHSHMNAMTGCAHPHVIYSLWHIPTSTLLVSTDMAREVERRIELVTSRGLILDELMLHIEQAGSLIGKQHLGSCMMVALHTPE